MFVYVGGIIYFCPLMRTRVTKYMLSLSVVLMACFGYLYSHTPAMEFEGSHNVTHLSLKQKNSDHVESSLSAYDANKAKFTTDNNDTEEEFSAAAKKFVKTGSCFISSIYSRAGYLSLSYPKCLYNARQFIAYSPQRLFIKFRVIRL